MPSSTVSRFALLAVPILFTGAPVRADEPAGPSVAEKVQEIAGVAEFLRAVPKKYATLQAVDGPRRRVTLLMEGEATAKAWDVAPDAEVKIAGWWGRLDQLTVGDRVWVWLLTDRRKQPTGILMLADELSQQDINGTPYTLASRTADALTLRPVKGPERTLQRIAGAEWSGDLRVGEKVYVQSAGAGARLLLDAAGFEARRRAQRGAMRQRWTAEGLPGAVAFLHRLSGELDVVLDHEAMRWGRSLRPGERVTLVADPPIPAVVKSVRPWRERTQLRLVVAAADQADLSAGQRLRVKRVPPPLPVDEAVLPPDLDRPRSKDERIEWFLASIYCVCKVRGDGCTGHFYTLASCNPNGCGMPTLMRKHLGREIDKGLTDRQIVASMLKERGPDLLRPHLLP